MASVSATEYATLNQQSTVWSDIISGTAYFNAAGANITLIAPNGTEMVTEASMTQQETGVFYYNYNFTVLDNWYASVDFYNASGSVALATASVSVIEEEQGVHKMLVSIILAIGLAAGLAVYTGINVKLDVVPKGRVLEKFALYFLGIALIPVSTWFAYVVSNNTTDLAYLSSMLLTVFMVSVVISVVIAYSYVQYMIEHIFDFGEKDEAEVDN